MVKIVNIHIPKTAGTSFRKSLEESYNNTLHDYGNKINRDLNELIYEFRHFNNNINLDKFNEINCISGHILPIKYRKLYDGGWKFVTWLREPSQRLYSQYFHLIKNSDVFDFGKYILENKLSFEDFVFLPQIKNFYQRFFYDFPVENYLFIGIVENYKIDLSKLSNLLDINLIQYNENFNTDKMNGFYEIDLKLFDKIKKYHSDDYNLYNKILNKNDYKS